MLADGPLLRIVRRVLPFVAVALFAALSCYQLRLPGLYYDEAFDVVPAMQLLRGDEVHLSRGVGIHALGRAFPVMIGDYWGVVSTYAVLPLFAIFGVGVIPIRLWTIAAGMLAIILTAVVGRKLYSRDVGLIASLLLAIFPSFVFWTRTGIYVISHIITIVLAIILSFLRWRETHRRRWLLLAMFLIGLGLSTKLLFVWFLIAVPCAYVLVLTADWLVNDRVAFRDVRTTGRSILTSSWDRFRHDVPLQSIWDAVLAFVAFVVGAFPVLYYNLISQGSFLVLRANLFETERGVDNFAILTNIRSELNSLSVLLNGGYFWYYGGIYQNSLYPWVAAIAAITLLILVYRVDEYQPHRRTTTFFLGFVVTTFFLSCFSVSILGPTHLLILLPIPQLTIAAAAVFGSRWCIAHFRSPSWAARCVLAAVGIILAALVVRDLWVDVSYHRALARTGGHSNFSSAIYTLAENLEREGIRHPYALDWGFKYPIMILTNGQVEPLDIYGSTFEPGPEFDMATRAALSDPNPVFIAHVEEASNVPRLDAFRHLVMASGREIVSQETILQLDGKPVFYVIHVE